MNKSYRTTSPMTHDMASRSNRDNAYSNTTGSGYSTRIQAKGLVFTLALGAFAVALAQWVAGLL